MHRVEHIFKRKIYTKILNWKTQEKGRTALLIEGARRVGKSTIVQEFAKNEYDSFLFIDFSKAPKRIIDLFEDVSDIDSLLMVLQFEFKVSLTPQHSLIIFDEIQFCPKARQAIKHLVADGRFDYIETGSLISISKNVKNILIPSEEESIRMNPMDFEEFLWAIGDAAIPDLLRKVAPLGKGIGAAHRSLMRTFRLYMLIGGMPQAVAEYLDSKDLLRVDKIKRDILNLYLADFKKIDESGRIGRLFENAPAQLNRQSGRFYVRAAIGDTDERKADTLISELAASFTVNLCHHTADPSNGLAMDFDKDYFKLYIGDTGLFVTLAFWDRDIAENEIYSKLLSDKLSANLGYVYENMVAQMLTASGRRLFYYTFASDHRHLYEIDFLIAKRSKVIPIEVKSSGYKAHKSLDMFCDKYSSKVTDPIIVFTKEGEKEGEISFVPIYILPFYLETL